MLSISSWPVVVVGVVRAQHQPLVVKVVAVLVVLQLEPPR
jgi:hypothetical protein